METEDYLFYKSLVFLLENNVKDIGYDLTMSTEVGGVFGTISVLFDVNIVWKYTLQSKRKAFLR